MEIIKELEDQAILFASMMKAKEYRAAKKLYDQARDAAVNAKLPEGEMIHFFGSREKEITGAFPEDKVQKAYFEVAVRG